MKEIVAKEGMWLTQKDIDSEENRIFAKKMLTPNVDLWIETTDENKKVWEDKYMIVESES